MWTMKKPADPGKYCRFIRISCLFYLAASPVSPGLASASGGFLETPDTAQVRPKLDSAQIQNFLPSRGEFTFPEPYNTQGVRLTNTADCGGSDCLWYVGYSYWRNINYHVGNDTMYIFLGLNRNRGGSGPTLFSYNKVTGQVQNQGPLFDADSALSWRSGEGWYFSGSRPSKLYIDDGPRMLRYDIFSKQVETVFDVRAAFGADKTIWQMHSSDNDRVHSATLRGADQQMLGCLVYREDTGQFRYFPREGTLDECHIDKSGSWLMSLENLDGQNGLEMRIFNLARAYDLLPQPLGDLLDMTTDLIAAGIEHLVWDQDGAVGHADMGYGYVVGSDNWNALANAILAWDFEGTPLTGQRVFHNYDWYNPPADHISHTNARPDVPRERQYACGSGASGDDSAWSNEVVCFRLDGSLDVLVVAPVMTDMNSSVGGDSYAKSPKGNLDVTGEYFIWTSNTGGSRVDAFVAKVPAQLLVDGLPGLPLPDDDDDNGNRSTGGSGGGADPLLPVLLGLVIITMRRKKPIRRAEKTTANEREY